MEVFFRTCPLSHTRWELAQRMLALWSQLRGLRVRMLQPPASTPEARFHFQSLTRKMADQLARDPIYILTDDDIEPLTVGQTHYFDKMRYTLEHSPEFAILSAWPEPAHIAKWTPGDDYVLIDNAHVQEVRDVGGLRVCRKGIVPPHMWPQQTRKGYDREHCEIIHALGMRVGYFKHLRAIHHGEGASDLYPSEDALRAQAEAKQAIRAASPRVN